MLRIRELRFPRLTAEGFYPCCVFIITPFFEVVKSFKKISKRKSKIPESNLSNSQQAYKKG